MDTELLLELVADGESVQLVNNLDGSYAVYQDASIEQEDGEVITITRSMEFDDLFDAHDMFCEYADTLFRPYQRPMPDDMLKLEIVSDNIDEFVVNFNKFLAECGLREVSVDEYNELQDLENLIDG